MYKITKTYIDYDGKERTEDFFFNLTKAECIKMQNSENGGMKKMLAKIIMEEDTKRLYEHFESIVDKSYGEKSLDGRRFMKSEEILANFKQTEAYSEIIVDLATNHEKAIQFINNVLPKVDDIPNAAPTASV